jgi:hypothetical protein
VNFVGTSGSATSNQINMTIQNTGSSSWTLQGTAQVNSVTGLKVAAWYPPYNAGKTPTALNCTNGNSVRIYILTTSAPWVSGNQYTITIYMTDGTKITYVGTTAPS